LTQLPHLYSVTNLNTSCSMPKSILGSANGISIPEEMTKGLFGPKLESPSLSPAQPVKQPSTSSQLPVRDNSLNPRLVKAAPANRGPTKVGCFNGFYRSEHVIGKTKMGLKEHCGGYEFKFSRVGKKDDSDQIHLDQQQTTTPGKTEKFCQKYQNSILVVYTDALVRILHGACYREFWAAHDRNRLKSSYFEERNWNYRIDHSIFKPHHDQLPPLQPIFGSHLTSQYADIVAISTSSPPLIPGSTQAIDYVNYKLKNFEKTQFLKEKRQMKSINKSFSPHDEYTDTIQPVDLSEFLVKYCIELFIDTLLVPPGQNDSGGGGANSNINNNHISNSINFSLPSLPSYTSINLAQRNSSGSQFPLHFPSPTIPQYTQEVAEELQDGIVNQWEEKYTPEEFITIKQPFYSKPRADMFNITAATSNPVLGFVKGITTEEGGDPILAKEFTDFVAETKVCNFPSKLAVSSYIDDDNGTNVLTGNTFCSIIKPFQDLDG